MLIVETLNQFVINTHTLVNADSFIKLKQYITYNNIYEKIFDFPASHPFFSSFISFFTDKKDIFHNTMVVNSVKRVVIKD